MNLFDISDWRVGWLEVAVGLPIATPGGGRTTSLRLPAAGDIIACINHNSRIYSGLAMVTTAPALVNQYAPLVMPSCMPQGNHDPPIHRRIVG